MKDPRQEKLTRLQRQHHRNKPWRLSPEGLYVPHCYKEVKPDDLSWYDDVGFILNRRRVFVDWVHPRREYVEEIRRQAALLAGDDPNDDWVLDGNTPQYKKVGCSRKTIVSYLCRSPSDEQLAYYEKKHEIERRLGQEGIEHNVYCSWNRRRWHWATNVVLVAPFEVRNEAELGQVAALARRLLLGQTTLEFEFPGYCYGKEQWLSESDKRQSHSWDSL